METNNQNQIATNTVYRIGKIISMTTYHKSIYFVKRLYQNFTNLFLLYYGKAIKCESGKVKKA
jgi:hypothetical protein